MSAAAADPEISERRRLERQLAELEPLARAVAARFGIPGLEREDVVQLARIAVWEALQVWDGTTTLRYFAGLVADRRLQDALTAARREKRRAEREAVRVLVGRDGELLQAVDLVPDPLALEERIEARAELRAVVAGLATLTELERHHLARVARGEAYAWRGADRDKSAENAVDRARAKIRRRLSAEHAA